MNWLRNMNIRMKMLLAFLFVSLLGMMLGFYGLYSSKRFSDKTDEIRIITAQASSFAPVIIAHYGWRIGLTEAVLTGSPFTGSLDPTTCSLGKWLNSDEAQQLKDATIKGLLRNVTDPHGFLHREANVIINKLKTGDKDGAMQELVNKILPKFDEVMGILTEINKKYNDLVEDQKTVAAKIAEETRNVIFFLIFIVLVCSIILALLTSTAISKPIVALSNFFKKASKTGNIKVSPEESRILKSYTNSKDEIGQMMFHSGNFIDHITEIGKLIDKIAEGDLNHDVELTSDEDTMGLALHRLFENLNKMFGEIHISIEQISKDANNVAETSKNIASSAEQMSNGAQSLAQGATDQAASVQRVSSSIAEIAEKTGTNAKMTDQAAKLANTIISKAEIGSRQMDDMITAVHEVTEASKSVRMIMETINGIAEQTNLLALNAAIEAARAGEHGKGFAVVAEEVRKLAAQSEKAVKETSTIIHTSMEKAELGARVAGEMAASLTEIVSGINESNHLIMKIAEASEEQTANISQINTSIEQVADIVERNSALAEESAAVSEESAAASEESSAASNEMRNQVTILRKLISQFKIKDEYDKRLVLPSGKQSMEKRSLPIRKK